MLFYNALFKFVCFLDRIFVPSAMVEAFMNKVYNKDAPGSWMNTAAVVKSCGPTFDAAETANSKPAGHIQ